LGSLDENQAQDVKSIPTSPVTAQEMQKAQEEK
jgi:hypothetical protein